MFYCLDLVLLFDDLGGFIMIQIVKISGSSWCKLYQIVPLVMSYIVIQYIQQSFFLQGDRGLHCT